jgi:hypothetical protein
MPGRFWPNADMAGRVVHSLNGRVGVARPQMPSSAERPQGKAPSKQRVLDCSRQTIRKLLGFGTDSTYVWVRRHRGTPNLPVVSADQVVPSASGHSPT